MGMTSRDLTDNVELMQIRDASRIIFGKYISVLRHFIERADEYKDLVIVARTHHQAAQPTTLGKRFSMWAEELLLHLYDFEEFINRYPLRGIKGAVGTQSDMIKLLGSQEKVASLESIIMNQLGFGRVLDSTGQVYPRSLDFKLLSHLVSLSSPCQNYSTAMRLMAGYDLVTEGFKEGQVGSTAMPHKMNTRSSERIWGFSELLKGYTDIASRLSGAQWEEGDVSCSVVRRVIIPNSFYASDGLCETTLTVLNEMGAYHKTIDNEMKRYAPFVGSSQVLMLAIQNGIGREDAHKIIKTASVEEALLMKEQGKKPDLVARLAENEKFREAGITKRKIWATLNNRDIVGNARQQVDRIIGEAESLIRLYRKEATYEPGDIL